MCLRLGGIPGRCDIAIFTLKHHEALGTPFELLPMRIGPGQVSTQHPVLALAGIQQERYRVCLQTIRPMGDQQAQRMGLNQRMQLAGFGLSKVVGDEHGRLCSFRKGVTLRGKRSL